MLTELAQNKLFFFFSKINKLRLVNPLSANPTKWSNTLKQFVVKLPTNCLSVLDHFEWLALKELKRRIQEPAKHLWWNFFCENM